MYVCGKPDVDKHTGNQKLINSVAAEEIHKSCTHRQSSVNRKPLLRCFIDIVANGWPQLLVQVQNLLLRFGKWSRCFSYRLMYTRRNRYCECCNCKNRINRFVKDTSKRGHRSRWFWYNAGSHYLVEDMNKIDFCSTNWIGLIDDYRVTEKTRYNEIGQIVILISKGIIKTNNALHSSSTSRLSDKHFCRDCCKWHSFPIMLCRGERSSSHSAQAPAI